MAPDLMEQLERLGDLRCFSNNNKQLDADGDDDDDDDGDDDDGDDDGCEAIERRCLSNKQQAASFSLNFSQISSAKAISSKVVNKNTDSDNYRNQKTDLVSTTEICGCFTAEFDNHHVSLRSL